MHKKLRITQKGQHNGIKEIAERANVSIGTVDRVIHNRAGVSAKTKAKILKIIKELDYQPNILARRLAAKKAFRIAMVMPRPTDENPYWKKHMEGIDKAENEVGQFGIEIERLLFSQNDLNAFKKELKKIEEGKYDGVILVPIFYKESISFSMQCARRKLPFVYFDTDIPEQDNLSYIGQDPYQSGYLAGELLHYAVPEKSSLLVVNIAKETDTHVNYLQRESGFTSFFKQNYPETDIIKTDIKSVDDDIIHYELDKLFLSNKNIKGIFVTNSRGYKIGRYLKTHQINDIRLIGYDLVDANVKYMRQNYIHFLISQRPVEQTYFSIQALYKHGILGQQVGKRYYMPIDILMKENLDYYNF